MNADPRRLQTIHERIADDHRDARSAAITWILLFAMVLWLMVGCASTVKQERVAGEVASFDGSEQNSGVIRSLPTGFLVTPHFRDRYNALIGVYGTLFRPPLVPNEGILPMTQDTWVIDREHMVKFLTMNQWARMARKDLP